MPILQCFHSFHVPDIIQLAILFVCWALLLFFLCCYTRYPLCHPPKKIWKFFSDGPGFWPESPHYNEPPARKIGPSGRVTADNIFRTLSLRSGGGEMG